MKLLQITSDNPKFSTIKFKDGLNLIVGTKIDKDKKETSNGVGKTISIQLINYLLAGQNKLLDQVLQDLTTSVTLQLKIEDEIHQISRNGEIISLDDQKLRLRELKEFLDKSVNNDSFTFRDLFLRFNRQSYEKATAQISTEEAFKNNAINAWLLGLDISYIEKKKELYNKQEALKQIIAYLKELQESVDKEEIYETKEELDKIEKDIENFEIAEDYYQIKEKADELTLLLRDSENRLSMLKRDLNLREELISVNKQEDVDISRVKRIYNEAKFFLDDKVIKHLEAVKEFHDTLFKNRKKKAEEEIEILTKEIGIEKQRIESLDKERSELLQYLESKGALEEYNKLLRYRDELKNKLQDLEAKEKEKERYKEEKQQLKLEIDKFELELIKESKKMKSKFESLATKFRDISNEFYEKPGYLDIDINPTMKAKYVYKIDPKIQADESSGIGMMKIFIYDMLLYALNPDLIGFSSHDNILYDVVDERQIATALDYAKENVRQYICSISDTKFQGALEYANQVDKNDVILELNEHNKLFGINF